MLNFTQLVRFAGVVNPGDPPTALRARLQHMQRLGFPAGVNFPKGERRRVSYDLDKTLVTGVALALMKAGASTARAVADVRRGIADLRGAYGAVAATRYASGTHAGSRPLLLVEHAGTRDGDTTRFDVVSEGDHRAFATIRIAAVLVDIDAMLAAIESIAPGCLEAMRSQADIVAGLTGSRLLAVDDISGLFGAGE